MLAFSLQIQASDFKKNNVILQESVKLFRRVMQHFAIFRPFCDIIADM